MDAPLGLLPEEPQRRFPLIRIAVAVLLVATAGLALLALRHTHQLELERERLKNQLEDARVRRPTPERIVEKDPNVEMMERRIAELEAKIRVLESRSGSSDGRAPNIEVDSPDRRRADSYALIEAGQKNLRRGDYVGAERDFLRASFHEPASAEPYGWLVLPAFVRGDYGEAWGHLRRAFLLDRSWLKSSRPPVGYFSSAEEYARYRDALELHLRQNPADAEAKLVLAYLYYHEKGPSYAKALTSEILGAHPEHADAKTFQKQLDSPGR